MILIDGTIAKVECKACGSIHKYKEQQVKSNEKFPATSTVPTRTKQSHTKINTADLTLNKQRNNTTFRSVSASKAEQAWHEAMLRHNNENPLPYSMNGGYAQHNFIIHDIFGKGEVISLTPPDKMSVLFKSGIKILRCKL
jgi:hypothetical protein